MANTKSALKQIRKNNLKRLQNKFVLKSTKTAIKKFKLELKKKKVLNAFPQISSMIESIGKNIKKKIYIYIYKILSIEEVISLKPDIAIFSAGAEISKKWAVKFSNRGTILIDNSSAWRMDKYKKLIVPEINGNILKKKIK